ncbi:MAG: DotU family type IV/VI secretion system protein [Phycisphaerae bacterium]
MALSVYDLAVEAVLYLVAFQRRVADSAEVSYEDTRAESLVLLNDLDQRSHTEPGLWDQWTLARVPVVYLIDEVMILNCPWNYRHEWANEPLEVALLGHPEALGGEKFYQSCDEAMKEMEAAEHHQRHDIRQKVEIVMVFYVAMQCGFKGKFALDLDAWREYKTRIFSKLPAYAQTRTKELFPEADDHTIRLDANYEPVTRLLYVLIAFAALLTIYLGGSWGMWGQLMDELRGFAKAAYIQPDEKLSTSVSLPAAAPTSLPTSLPASLPSGS